MVLWLAAPFFRAQALPGVLQEGPQFTVMAGILEEEEW